MWKVADESNMFVTCNPESNFPISLELQFGGRPGTQEYLDNNHGMWFSAEDANRLILQLAQAIETVRAAEHQMHLTGGTSRQNSDPVSDELSDKAVGSPTRK